MPHLSPTPSSRHRASGHHRRRRCEEEAVRDLCRIGLRHARGCRRRQCRANVREDRRTRADDRVPRVEFLSLRLKMDIRLAPEIRWRSPSHAKVCRIRTGLSRNYNFARFGRCAILQRAQGLSMNGHRVLTTTITTLLLLGMALAAVAACVYRKLDSARREAETR